MIDMGATHSFISLDCAIKLNLQVSYIVEIIVIDTLTNGLVTTSWVCLNFTLTIYGKDFCIDLVYLPLSQLDVILRMNYLEFNHVHINYFDKSVMFIEFGVGENQIFMEAKQVEESLKEGARVFMMFASFKAESKVVFGDLLVVCDFP